MNLRQNYAALATVVTLCVMASCSSGGGKTPMAELGQCYEEIALNNQKVADAFGEVYQASRDQQEMLQAKAQATAEDVKIENENLAKKAAELGAALVGAEIECEVSPSLGYSVEKAVFGTVQAGDKLANIVVDITTTGAPSGSPRILFFDKDGNVVYKTSGYVSDGKVGVNFRITTSKGPEVARTFASVTKLVIVTDEECNAGKVGSATSASVDAVSPDDYQTEKEPAFIGDDSRHPAQSAPSQGEIRRGANLVATLRQFANITWDYNADFGVTANVGDYWLVISDDDLTPQGLEVINSIPSDMENDIKFSIDYIKPTAKVGEFQRN